MFELIRANQQRTIILMFVMLLILLFAGYAIGEAAASGAGLMGSIGAFIAWIVMSAVSYFNGDKILLGVSGARRIEKKDHPVLFNVVEEMCVASGNPRVPEIYIIDDDAPNAFATGRDPEHASVAVTSGLLALLSRDELQGVIGHEVAHVSNRDILYMMMAGVMVGTIVFIADMGRRMFYHGGTTRTGGRRRSGGGIALVVALIVFLIAPIVARFLYLAISRRREYLADACGAQYSRYPEGLATALEKIAGSATRLANASDATAPMYIVNPMKLTASGLSDLSATHPPTSERVRILRSMGGTSGLGSYNDAFRKVTGRAVGVVPFAAVQSSAAEPARAPVRVDSETHLERVRQTTDALWSMQNYLFVRCPCETTLKVPPIFLGKKIDCPHCGRAHEITKAP